MKRIMPLALCMLFVFVTSTTFAQLKGKQLKWEKLGKKVISMKAEKDVMLVTRLEGTFTAVKFKVLKAPIHLHTAEVIYGNGASNMLTINKKIPAGSDSRVFDLPGNKRIIKKIIFKYKTVPTKRGKSIIVAAGRH